MSVTIELELKPTTRQLAELFCSLDSTEMAEFFTHCYEISESWPHRMGIYRQALFVKDEAPPNTDAASFIMNFAAPWYAHTLLAIDKARSA